MIEMGLTDFAYLLFIGPKHRLGMLYLTKVVPNLCSCIPKGVKIFFSPKL